MPNVSFRVYAPGFVSRFLESHAVMLQGNAGLKPKEGEITSRPWQWPINYRVSLCGAFIPHILLACSCWNAHTTRAMEKPPAIQRRRLKRISNPTECIDLQTMFVAVPFLAGSIFLRQHVSHLSAWQPDHLVEQFDIFGHVPGGFFHFGHSAAARLQQRYGRQW